jgi:hypothetical protein
LILSCSFSELIVFGVDAIAVETRPHAQYSAPATLLEVDIFMIAMLSLFPQMIVQHSRNISRTRDHRPSPRSS